MFNNLKLRASFLVPHILRTGKENFIHSTELKVHVEFVQKKKESQTQACMPCISYKPITHLPSFPMP